MPKQWRMQGLLRVLLRSSSWWNSFVDKLNFMEGREASKLVSGSTRNLLHFLHVKTSRLRPEHGSAASTSPGPHGVIN